MGVQGEGRFTPFDIVASLIFIRSARISRNFTLPSPATGSGRVQFFATLSASFPRWAINADMYYRKSKATKFHFCCQKLYPIFHPYPHLNKKDCLFTISAALLFSTFPHPQSNLPLCLFQDFLHYLLCHNMP